MERSEIELRSSTERSEVESRADFAQDDTQRYGLLKDDALTILCTDFKIGVTHPNLACKNIDFWERALVAERQCGKTK